MVLNGTWSESESTMMLHKELDDFLERFPTEKDWKIFEREQKKMMVETLGYQSSHQVSEREYYFDEGLGESLEEHVRGLQESFPGMQIKTRRDHDGLPIVHMVMKPQFKYNIDDIMSTGPEEFDRIHRETIDAIYGDQDPKSILSSN